MQSDQFHYLHHAKFECNYGSASFPLDALFGTFRRVPPLSASPLPAGTARVFPFTFACGPQGADGRFEAL